MIGEEITHWDTMDFYEDYQEYCERMIKEAKSFHYDMQELEENLTISSWEHSQTDDQDLSWEDMQEALTLAMTTLNHDTSYWRATGRNLGWLHRCGYKVFRAETGLELIRACLPDTDKTFVVSHYTDEKRGNKAGLHITCSHHDAMGEEYIVMPLSAEEWEAEEGGGDY